MSPVCKLWGGVRRALMGFLFVAIVLLVIVLTVDVLLGVATRFILGDQLAFTDELARMSLVCLSFLGGAYAFESHGHLGVDFFVQQLNPCWARVSEVIVASVVLVFAAVVLVYGGIILAHSQWTQDLTTLAPVTRGMVYGVIPLSGCFICLFTLEHLFTALFAPTTSKEGEV